ncbi:hypothetical protein CIB48_g3562 [Xylaria polymorpha]|nr:hypothetical protein CIB48_g3562 [Xylaria polymorpha]
MRVTGSNVLLEPPGSSPSDVAWMNPSHDVCIGIDLLSITLLADQNTMDKESVATRSTARLGQLRDGI